MIEFLKRNYDIMKEHGHTDRQLITQYEFAVSPDIYHRLPQEILDTGKYQGIVIVQDNKIPMNYVMLRKIEIKSDDVVNGIYVEAEDNPDSVA